MGGDILGNACAPRVNADLFIRIKKMRLKKIQIRVDGAAISQNDALAWSHSCYDTDTQRIS